MSKKKVEDQNKLEKRVSELESQLKRAVADYQNLERRITEGKSELSSWASAELIKQILPVLDHLETVVDSGRQVLSERSESKEWFRGVELAVKELKDVLARKGLDQIPTDPSTALGTGVQFDPNLHEAVDTREPSSAEASEGKVDNSILEVTRKGYTLNGKVLRPAQVVVGRVSSDQSQESSEANNLTLDSSD